MSRWVYHSLFISLLGIISLYCLQRYHFDLVLYFIRNVNKLSPMICAYWAAPVGLQCLKLVSMLDTQVIKNPPGYHKCVFKLLQDERRWASMASRAVLRIWVCGSCKDLSSIRSALVDRFLPSLILWTGRFHINWLESSTIIPVYLNMSRA